MRQVKTLGIVVWMVCSFFSTNHTLAQSGNSFKHLSKKEQSFIAIASTAGMGHLSELKTKLHAGLDAGLTINEIKEIMVHLYAYCGFPRSIRGLQTLMEVLDERKAKGIEDEWGADASPISDERSKYDRGKANLEELIGRPLNEPQSAYAAFAPTIEVFLKEHLFADIFDRDVLTFADRELVSISVISAIGGAEPMLKSHLAICLNLGFSHQQLNEFLSVIKSTVGKKEAKAAQLVLNEVLSSR
jgi:alkylhydroperoxidase/carboxymuconolactone decarboxylase family protein YurZ